MQWFCKDIEIVIRRLEEGVEDLQAELDDFEAEQSKYGRRVNLS